MDGRTLNHGTYLCHLPIPLLRRRGTIGQCHLGKNRRRKEKREKKKVKREKQVEKKDRQKKKKKLNLKG
jgi:hypothetical protein